VVTFLEDGEFFGRRARACARTAVQYPAGGCLRHAHRRRAVASPQQTRPVGRPAGKRRGF